MWFLLLILSFTTADIVDPSDHVDPDDNIAMESRPQPQALYYRAKYHKPEYYYRAEEDYNNNDYNDDDYHSTTKSSLRQRKKYYPHNDKENIYLNKNNYVNRAREPRDESWRPVTSPSEEDAHIVKHYHYDDHPKPQKVVPYYDDAGSKKTKKYEEPHDEHKQQTHRYKKHQPQGASNYDKPTDQYRQPDQSQQEGLAIGSRSPFLQQIEEETKSGKMLGFASLVEHFSAEDDEEEMKAALKEGSLDDIKRTVPKSGMVFKIFQDDQKAPMSIEDFSYNDLDNIEFKPSASTYYSKPSSYKDEPPKKPVLPNKVPLQTEKKKMKKIKIPLVPSPPPKMKPTTQSTDDDEEDDMKFHEMELMEEEKQPEMMIMPDRPLPKPMKMSQERPRPKPVQMNQDRPHRPQPPPKEPERPHRPQPPKEPERPHRPQSSEKEPERPHRPQHLQMEQERPHRPQPPPKSQERPKHKKPSKSSHDQPQDSKSQKSHSESSRYVPVLQETRSFPQIEAASRQRYRPIHLALNDNEDYNYYHQSNNNYPAKQTLRYQEGQESQQQYQFSSPDGYSNHNWAASEGTSESEITIPGSHSEALIVHSNPEKAPESSKNYYDYFKAQSSNHKPENFDHTKALKGSISFNAANIIGNHNHGKDTDVESTRTPIQFVSESEATPKYKIPSSGNTQVKQHIQKYAETLFKNLYKIKDDEQEESPRKVTSHRHHYPTQEPFPSPAALVSIKVPKFEAETPMMTEDEFQYKFGHLPVVTTPKSYYFTTISTPLKEVIKLEPSKPPNEALTQYWTVPERETYKIPSAHDYHQHSKYQASKFQATNQQSYKTPSTRYNEQSGEASNNNYKNTKGQIERPSTNWKDGQLYLTKEFQGKLSDLYIKSSDRENLHHSSSLSNDRPSRQKKIVINADLVPHVHDSHAFKKTKYDVSLLPSYRLQKRGDKDKDNDSSKNVALVSEKDRKGKVRFPPLETGFKPMFQGGIVEPEKKSSKKQGIIITGSDDRDNRHFSVSASYQIDRSSKSENSKL